MNFFRKNELHEHNDVVSVVPCMELLFQLVICHDGLRFGLEVAVRLVCAEHAELGL